MVNRKSVIGMSHGVIIILLVSLLLIPTILFGKGVDEKTNGDSKGKANFDLRIKDDLIFLNAIDASLKEIMEEIGSKMVIDVVGNIPEGEKISVEFDGLLLKDALEKLSASYGYVMDAEKGEKEITKIIILPKGKEASSLRITARDSQIQEGEGKESRRPEPFKFEFDPSEYMEEGK